MTTLRDAAQAVVDSWGSYIDAICNDYARRGVARDNHELSVESLKVALTSPPTPPEHLATELLRELVAVITQYELEPRIELHSTFSRALGKSREFLAAHPKQNERNRK